MNKFWKKDIVSWKEGKNIYISIPFTWLLPKAKELALKNKNKKRTIVGGPAVKLIPEYLTKVATIGAETTISPLLIHNPFATFTTKGCPNKCKFCAVPKIEGEFKELKEFEIKPLVCDNNFLESSKKHFDFVIDRLKKLEFVDFNQGLDARKFKKYHADRFTELKNLKLRFSLDHISLESKVYDAIYLAKSAGLKDINIYVLIGYKDTPEEAYYKLEKIREWGCLPNPMRYQPLDALEKNSYVEKGWSEQELKRMTRYYSRLNYLSKIPYKDFQIKINQNTLF